MTNTQTPTRSKFDALVKTQKNYMNLIRHLRNSIIPSDDPIRAMQISSAEHSLSEVTQLIGVMWDQDRSLLNDHSMTADQAVRQCIASRNFK